MFNSYQIAYHYFECQCDFPCACHLNCIFTTSAAVVHILTCTTIYIDAGGCEEIRTIMRAEQVAIHTTLTRFEDNSWIGIFTDSLSNLLAIRLRYYRPGLTIAPHCHHHMLLLHIISNLLETRWEKRLLHNPSKNQGTHTHPRQRPSGRRS